MFWQLIDQPKRHPLLAVHCRVTENETARAAARQFIRAYVEPQRQRPFQISGGLSQGTRASYIDARTRTDQLFTRRRGRLPPAIPEDRWLLCGRAGARQVRIGAGRMGSVVYAGRARAQRKGRHGLPSTRSMKIKEAGKIRQRRAEDRLRNAAHTAQCQSLWRIRAATFEKRNAQPR